MHGLVRTTKSVTDDTMTPALHHRAWHYLLLIGIGVHRVLSESGGATLWDLDEGRNATAALEDAEIRRLDQADVQCRAARP